MHRSLSFGLIGLLPACILAAQKQEAPPKDLMEYVRQARKAGLADSQIKLKAVGVGWPPEDLDTALEPPGGAPAAKPKTAETRKPAPKHSPSPSGAAIKPAEPPRMVNEPVVGRGAAPAAAANPAPDDEYSALGTWFRFPSGESRQLPCHRPSSGPMARFPCSY